MSRYALKSESNFNYSHKNPSFNKRRILLLFVRLDPITGIENKKDKLTVAVSHLKPQSINA